VGCSDPYSASLNGDQGGLGPRWETNAWTGFFEYPFDNPSYSGGLARRLVVDNDDLASSSYPGAVYYAAACYVHPEDAEDNNHWNNHSIRKVDVGNFSSGGYNISLTGSTRIGQTPPEILIYEDVDSALVRDVDIPDEGRFTVGMTCCDNGDGTWTYNYMIFNVNSHLSCSGLEIPLGSGVTATDMNFSDADYHSGEPYDNEDWDMNVLSNSVFWSSPKESENPNANAIRWHSMHTFWFTADSPPATGDVILDLHRDHPDGIDAITFKGYIPSDLSEPCIGDINGDQIVDGTDLGFLLGAWGVTPPPWGDFDGNNIVDGVDLGVLLGNWGFCR
ncbi:MAG: hypothetical protein CMJ32_04675, partial [Phycisphaerae bacterium]|nr:hypothetical protein [Phycisphaerae bacterium]